MPETPSRPDPADRFILTLAGVVCGEVIAAEGGDISAPVIREPDASGFVRKHLGPAAPKPIKLAFDLSLRPVVYEWINAFWQGQMSKNNGSLISVDPGLRAKGELIFEGAVITTMAFPTVDATISGPGRLAITLRPERTTFAPSFGQTVQGLVPKEPSRFWGTSNFRLQIDGLNCTRVSKIDAALITRSADVIDFPDLSITLAEADSEQWDAWQHEFVEQGENDEGHEKTGTLAYLGPDMETQLGSVKLSGLGIYRLVPDATAEESRRDIKRLVASLYCQQMEFSITPSPFTPR